jgi:chorismate mutase
MQKEKPLKKERERMAAIDGRLVKLLSLRLSTAGKIIKAKYSEHKEDYDPLILRNDRDAIMSLLTDSNVEKQVLARARKNAQDHNINPDLVAALYKEMIIPLTKESEADYILKKKLPKMKRGQQGG